MRLLLTSFTWLTAGECSPTRRRVFASLAIVIAAVTHPFAASQVKVTEDSGNYTVSAWFTVPQSTSAAFAVLTDYEHLPNFMPGLKKSVLIERTDAHVVLEQDATAKFLAFSKNIHLRLDVEEAGQTIRFRDTSLKSFSQYEGTWRVSTKNGETLISYDLVANPSFAVPNFLLRRLLGRDAAEMIEALQKEIAARAR